MITPTAVFAQTRVDTVRSLTASGDENWSGNFARNGTNGTVYALAVDPNGTVYAGGGFDKAGTVIAANIAFWNGTAWSPLAGGMSARVRALAIGSGGLLYAGGSFDTAGMVPASNIVCWTGTTWVNLGSGTDSNVFALKAEANGYL